MKINETWIIIFHRQIKKDILLRYLFELKDYHFTVEKLNCDTQEIRQTKTTIEEEQKKIQ